uniref:Protein kinase domain-containing protein n=1 Tax=Mycena chlorophos TaxID=658473 RepID=A0ABQ0MDS1_MYCCL|nr:predicted protein [Mycena chlorophos]
MVRACLDETRISESFQSLSSFSSLTLHDCLRKSGTGVDSESMTNSYTTAGFKFPLELEQVSEDDMPPIPVSRTLISDNLPPYREDSLPDPPAAAAVSVFPLLNLRLGRRLGVGRCGVVLETEVFNTNGQPPEAQLPPLVAKISRQGYQEELLYEARAYKEMRIFQGTVIARTYGLYKAYLSQEANFVDRAVAQEYDAKEGDRDFPPESYRLRKRHANVAERLVYVLLLEGLGKPLEFGVRHPPSCLESMLALYEDLFEFGFYHLDFALAHILPRGADEGLICPKHGINHEYRLIDFHLFERTALDEAYLVQGAHFNLKNLFEAAEFGQQPLCVPNSVRWFPEYGEDEEETRLKRELGPRETK